MCLVEMAWLINMVKVQLLAMLLLLLPASKGMVQLPLTMPGTPGTRGEMMGPGAKICYNLTLSDNAVKEVVWWEQAKLILRLEPCVGKPHLLVRPHLLVVLDC